MQVRAVLRFARITPRKARRVAQTISGLPVLLADVRLQRLTPRAAPMFLKLLRSAVANARHNLNIEAEDLTVEVMRVNEGPRLKRWMPRARGRADRLLKRTSHLEVVLSDQKPEGYRRTKEGAAIETKRVEELTAEELREREKEKTVGGRERTSSAVKPKEAPRGLRRLITRKHGE